MRKKVVIVGGGTFSHIYNHLSLAAPAFGSTAKQIAKLVKANSDMDVDLRLTKMADPNSTLVTNNDMYYMAKELIADLTTKIVFWTPALVDYEVDDCTAWDRNPNQSELKHPFGKNTYRLTEDVYTLGIGYDSLKVIESFRASPTGRKDIFLVGFKTTCGATPDKQYLAGLKLLKENSCNLVLVNDVQTRLNMVICPEEAVYHETTDRQAALAGLVEMALLRSHLTFTRSTVVAGEPVRWDSELVYPALHAVVEYCINKGSYKPFLGVTAGHFAQQLSDTEFLTSRRKTNFNNLKQVGMVRVKTDGPDSVIAYGSKPSVGGQSQRIVFKDHPGMDCIVHMHVQLKPGSKVPVASQREFECGSHECGQNTSSNLGDFGEIKAVMLDQHGPNIVFNHNIDPQKVIDFIEANFDLESKTGGYQL